MGKKSTKILKMMGSDIRIYVVIVRFSLAENEIEKCKFGFRMVMHSEMSR